ncbi:MAG: AraC family transcriptional regulator [Lysobacteraceae bacterium]
MQVIDPDKAARPLFVLSERYAATEGPWHSHRRAQFIHASEGVLTVRSEGGLWVVPPQRAVWILPGLRHRVSATREFRLRTLYADATALPMPDRCCVVVVDPLLDALLQEASVFGADYPVDGPEARIMQVIVDRLSQRREVKSALPLPRDPRLQRMARPLVKHPDDPRPLEALAAAFGMSGRTAARRCLADTGLRFGQWRQQLRLLKALEALSRGDSVAQAAHDVGYADTSSFITVFKAAFGDTPARHFRRD